MDLRIACVAFGSWLLALSQKPGALAQITWGQPPRTVRRSEVQRMRQFKEDVSLDPWTGTLWFRNRRWGAGPPRARRTFSAAANSELCSPGQPRVAVPT